MLRSSPPPLTRRWFYVAENTDKIFILYIASCSKACLWLLIYIHQVSQHLKTIIRSQFGYPFAVSQCREKNAKSRPLEIFEKSLKRGVYFFFSFPLENRSANS